MDHGIRKAVDWAIRKDENGEIIVVTFNDGYSTIGPDGGCWVIRNGGKLTTHIFPEAMDVLALLPRKPNDYVPLFDYLTNEMTDSNKPRLEVVK